MGYPKYCGWSDESSHNKGDFRAIGMISHPYRVRGKLEENINRIIDSVANKYKNSRRELKWSRIDKFRFRAYKSIIDYFLEKAKQRQVRLDVLRWDIKDPRHHDVLGRDDNKNLQMMYYKLLYNVISRRWQRGHWTFFPDENGIIDWDELKLDLDNGISKVNLKEELNIKIIKEVNSKNNVLIQVADLFTGLSIFSKDKFSLYMKCKDYMDWKNGQQRLVPLKNDFSKISNKNKMRLKILYYFNKKCKRLKMGVSLEKKRGLWTPDPRNTNINFWHYEPQVEEDKAPTK